MSHTPFTPADPHTSRPDLRGRHGMVTSTHWLATAAGQSVLERGGNAVDAAVATAFVLHVVEPHLNGAGGDLVGLLSVAGAAPRVIAGQGAAPKGAGIQNLEAEGIEVVPGAGSLAAAIPGAVPAWLDLLATHGSWPLGDVLAYAIDLAENGYPASPGLCRTIAAVETLFTEHWHSSRDEWMPHGTVPRPGDTLFSRDYAATLRRLAAAGPGGPDGPGRTDADAAAALWSTGFVAEAIDAFVRVPHRHSDGRDHAGVLTADDLAGHRARTEPAVTVRFRDVEIAKSDAWASGPVLLQALQILDTFDDAHLDPSTALGIHTIVEALKLAMADREAYYGDGPDRVDTVQLLDPAYAATRAELIGDTASHEWRPGVIGGRTPYVPPLRTPAEALAAGLAGSSADDGPAVPIGGTGEPTVQSSGVTNGDTCHFDVVDAAGTMISATPSGGWLQSSPTIPALGFCLGTRLQMTWLDPASPAALAPGRRPRTTLSPTMVLRDGVPVEALGTPGGDQQDQWQLPYLLRRIVGRYTPQQAVDAPSFHTDHLPSSFWPRAWLPGSLTVEDRLGEDVIADLERRGHVVERAGDWMLGRLSSVTRDPDTGWLGAAANPRGGLGYAAGR